MSVPKRKIGYYFIEFTEKDEKSFDRGLFKRLLQYINGLTGKDRIISDRKSNKAMDIEKIEIIEGENEFARIIFKSCKYNHSPNYMSSEDGSERKTDKKLTEGDKEITHMLLKIDDKEAYTIFEERRAGVSIGNVINFFNKNLRDLKEKDVISDDRILEFGIVPSEDFLRLIDKSDRIISAELYTDNQILGSEYLNILDLDNNTREDITVTIKAKKRESLVKATFRNLFIKLTAEETKVKRIRLYTKDDNNLNVIVDTNRAKKLDEITVSLKKDGTVDSDSIFAKMEQLLEDDV